MIRIGLTGGIGSGKSTACRIFAMLGVAIYDSDANAKRLMVTDNRIVSKIKSIFTEEAYIENQLNRSMIAQRVFSNPDLLAQLNAIIHPAVQDNFNIWAERQLGKYVIEESAILFESGAGQDMDYTIAVTAPEDIRIKRCVLRDRITEGEVRNRIAHQMSDNERAAKADFILYADDKQLLIPQIIELHNKLYAL